jgi:hypothetical protein
MNHPEIDYVAAIKKFGGLKPAARALNIPATTFARQLRKAQAVGPNSPEIQEPSRPTIRPRSLDDFRRQYDVPDKIRRQLRGLGSRYVTEDELRQLCDVPVAFWRRNAELPEFSSNKFKLDGVVYWSSQDTIRQMKQISGRA